MAILCVKYRQKLNFYVKNRKNMRFSWDLLQNMLENGHSNLQTKFGVHITSNIFKIIQFKNHRIAQPPNLPTLKAYPTPGVGGRFEIFSLKWRKKDELEGTWSNFTPWLRDFEHHGENCWGVVATPLRRIRVNRHTDMQCSKVWLPVCSRQQKFAPDNLK